MNCPECGCEFEEKKDTMEGEDLDKEAKSEALKDIMSDIKPEPKGAVVIVKKKKKYEDD